MKRDENVQSGKPSIRAFALGAICAVATLGLAAIPAAPARADEAPQIHFGVPTWPGVTVQSEIAARLLEAMGYRTKQTNASPSFALNGIKTGEVDVYLGGWMPTEKHMIDPLVESGEAMIMTTNIANALMGMAVPDYVWEAGVHSVTDLDDHAEKFEHTIYGIEPGSGFNTAVQKAIDEDQFGLGDWNMLSSSTAAALAQVGHDIKRHHWFVFLGWEPHWMNVTYDIKYLKAAGDHTIAQMRSDVLTVANPETMSGHPEVARFLRQFQVAKDTMSMWILEYSYKKRDLDELVNDWIGSHLDVVARWLDGVRTRGDQPAIEAVRARYGN